MILLVPKPCAELVEASFGNTNVHETLFRVCIPETEFLGNCVSKQSLETSRGNVQTPFFSPVCVQRTGRLEFCIFEFVSYFVLRISYFLKAGFQA
ncbi:MAG: hypothetical protein A2W17_07340 [Planctomycetes bacterium RBG_16_41_13]|nr:MAG: hypothetical protein A2W17_07340 [Planctomycetes bacterium RBG_16_41_13]